MPVEPIPGGAAFVGRRRSTGSAGALPVDVAFRTAPLSPAEWSEIDERLAKRFSGFFASRLMDRALPWRGLRHLATLSLFELNPAVESIEVMPERVTMFVDGRARDYTPHFRLRSAGGVAMADVLRYGQERNPARARVTALLRDIYAHRGIRYCALPEGAVTAEPVLGNARAVLACRGYDPPPEAELSPAATQLPTRRSPIERLLISRRWRRRSPETALAAPRPHDMRPHSGDYYGNANMWACPDLCGSAGQLVSREHHIIGQAFWMLSSHVYPNLG